MILFLFFIILLLIFAVIYCNKKRIQEDQETAQKNKILLEENLSLQHRLSSLKEDIEDNLHNLENIQKVEKTTIENSQELSKQAFKNYCEVLEKNYEEEEKEYDVLLKNLNNIYNEEQMLLLDYLNKKKDDIDKEINNYLLDLDKIKQTRNAAIQAQLREKEVLEKQEFYSLSIDENDLNEIKAIESISHLFRNRRPLRMMIWSNYYLKAANQLCSNILGSSTVTGIYKITEKETGLCYIGQATDVKERFRDHMKHGLGIDTPSGNKLYSLMQEKGLVSFTFELLEKCSLSELDEKEKFYIDLYDSYNYGLNNNRGIGINKYNI